MPSFIRLSRLTAERRPLVRRKLRQEAGIKKEDVLHTSCSLQIKHLETLQTTGLPETTRKPQFTLVHISGLWESFSTGKQMLLKTGA